MFDLSSITTGKQARPPRMILLGIEKAGKSSFAAGSDNPIFIPTKGEEGIDDLDVSKFPVATTYSDLMAALKTLYTEDHSYQTVVIDSASTLEPIIHKAICEEDPKKPSSIELAMGGYGKGYVEALGRWRNIMDALDMLRTHKNMASILIGHVTVKLFNDPLGDSYDQYEFDIHKKAAASLYRWADVIGFANTKNIVKTEESGFGNGQKKAVDISQGQRYLYTNKSPSHPSGGRGAYGHLPKEIPLDWNSFKTAVSNAQQ
jgi:hypothetical protein